MRTFFLGLGAQKSGTTWLFKQLIKSNRFSPGLCKEYHLFDYLHLDSKEVRKNAANRINNFKNGDPTLDYEQKLRLIDCFYSNTEHYYDYIDKILTDESKFTTDITPAYAHLDSDVLSDIKLKFEKRNVQMKVIYLMREPVSRMESGIRMKIRRLGKLGKVDAKEMKNIMDVALSSEALLKSHYSFTVNQLDKVFAPADIFYCFYEELFHSQSIIRLAKFFDIPVSVFEPNEIINSTRQHYRYAKRDLNRWIEQFEHEYDFAKNRFNFDTEIWRSALFEKLGVKPQWKRFWK